MIDDFFFSVSVGIFIFASAGMEVAGSVRNYYFGPVFEWVSVRLTIIMLIRFSGIIRLWLESKIIMSNNHEFSNNDVGQEETAWSILENYNEQEANVETAQEKLEGKLNERLLKIDTLEKACQEGGFGVSKYEEDFGDKTIPVYVLEGMPFRMLSTTIDYRKHNNPGEIGTETYKSVLRDPGFWMQRREEAEQSAGYGTRNANARGNTISASYVYSEKNLSSSVDGSLTYGFDHVENDSVISVSNGDGGTSNVGGDAESKISTGDEIDMLESAGGSAGYNEVLLRRYSKDGEPKRPDYIICYDDYISRAAKKHATYYDIPIVLVQKKEYVDRAKWNGWELLNSVNEDMSFEETSEKMDELLSMSMYKDLYKPREAVGRVADEDLAPKTADPIKEKCREVAQEEFKKRLIFIKTTLESEIVRLNEANDNNVAAGAKTPGLDMLSITYSDVQAGEKHDGISDMKSAALRAPGACSNIRIDFRMAGSPRFIKTTIFDGARVFDKEHASLTKDLIEDGDSSIFDALQPLVVDYFKAYRKNQAILKASLNPNRAA